jgi:hypothetical protein
MAHEEWKDSMTVLLGMGFSESTARRAAQATNGKLEAAIDFIQDEQVACVHASDASGMLGSLALRMPV